MYGNDDGFYKDIMYISMPTFETLSEFENEITVSQF